MTELCEYFQVSIPAPGSTLNLEILGDIRPKPNSIHHENVMLGMISALEKGVITPSTINLSIGCYKRGFSIPSNLYRLFIWNLESSSPIPATSALNILIHECDHSHEYCKALGFHYLFRRHFPVSEECMDRDMYTIEEPQSTIQLDGNTFYYVKRVPLAF